MLTYYEILQVSESASADEIKKAYRRLCKILHPDLHSNSKEANVIFNLLHEAYETLYDPAKKSNYNPKQHTSITSEKYNGIITEYKKIVTDYERIVNKKNQREKELLNQIKQLKESKYQRKNSEQNKNSLKTENKIESKPVSKNQGREQRHGVWRINVLITLIILVFITLFVLISMIPDGLWFFIILLGLPVWLIYSVLKSFF